MPEETCPVCYGTSCRPWHKDVPPTSERIRERESIDDWYGEWDGQDVD